jgi:hypothetical protein
MLTSGRQASDDIRKIKDKLKESVNEKITKLHKVISMYELRWFEKALDQLFEVRHARIVSVHTIPTYLCLLILHVNPHLNPLIAYAVPILFPAASCTYISTLPLCRRS